MRPEGRCAVEGDGLICAICRDPLRDDERDLARFRSGYRGWVCKRCAKRLASKSKAGAQ